MFGAFREGGRIDVQSYQIYEGIKDLPAVKYKLSPEIVDGIVAALDKLNQRWPGFLTPVPPPKPEPVDRLTVLWIMNPSVIWQQVKWFITPTMEEVYRVAGATC